MEDRGRLNEHDRTNIKLLKAAINFLLTAMEDGADLRNAVGYNRTPVIGQSKQPIVRSPLS